jgi:hypothetical protein
MSAPGTLVYRAGLAGRQDLGSEERPMVEKVTRLRTWMTAAVSVALVALAVAPVTAHGAFGDDFNLLPINGGSGTVDVPALPDVDAAGQRVYSHYFWAGTCDRAAAPAPPAAIDGGVGSLPATVEAPTFTGIGYTIAQVAPPPRPTHCIDWRLGSGHGTTTMWTTPPSWRLAPVVEAGAHPDGSTTMAFDDVKGDADNIIVSLPPGFIGNPNAVDKCTAAQFTVRPQQCSPRSQVGVLSYRLAASSPITGANAPGNENVYHVPVFNLEPREGNVAELGLIALSQEGQVTARIVAKARTAGDFGVTAFVGQIPSALPLYAQNITLWGVPWAAHNDVWRAPEGVRISPPTGCAEQPGATGAQVVLPASGLPAAGGCRRSYDPSWGPVRPFLSNETDCNPSPVVGVHVDAYQRPGSFTADGDPADGDPNWKTARSPSPPVTECDRLGFEPDIAFEATDGSGGVQRSADGPAGLNVELSIPQNNEPKDAGGDPLAPTTPGYVAAATDYFASAQGRATAHLKDSVVTLPAGMSVNPSAASGLQACSDSGIGLRRAGSPPLFNNGDPFDKDGGADGAECPDASKIGTVQVRTPLLDEVLDGEVVLGEPKSTDPQSGEMFRLFLVVRSVERGLIAKVYGSTKADPSSGQLVTTFANNPEVPFDRLALQIKGGPRGLLGLPHGCGAAGWSSAFRPWSAVGAPVPVADRPDGGSFAVDANCNRGFSPSLTAGMSTRAARGFGSFSFDFSRADGEGRFAGLTAKLPQGLLASVKGVALCTNAQAAAGSCPAASRIGSADAAAGSGNPFVLEEKGEVFLTEGYKGCPYGLAVKIRAIAGPFRGAMELSPIIVRQAVCVDRSSAQVSAVSDPFPLIHHGVPLRVRRVVVDVNRPRFMLNPSSCAAKRVRATLTSEQGGQASPTAAFRASDCARMPFRPKLSMRLTGRREVRTGRHPGVRAKVTQRGIREAGIKRAVVRLPRSLALDVDNAQALCEFEAGIKADLEKHCPKGSIVGRAKAVSPLLNRPLAGNVYFVKNVRRSSSGNLIRTLPMIIVALRGEIAINLKGESSVDRSNRLVSTFRTVPDAPVSRFNLNIKGGRNGILAITRTRRSLINICRSGRQVAQSDFNAHNGRRFDRDITMRKPCPSRKVKKNRRNNRR